MSDESATQCTVAYDAADNQMLGQDLKMILRLGAIPWARVIIDTLLVAGILLASSNLLSVR